MVSGDSDWERNRQTDQTEVSVVSHVSELATRYEDTKATVKVDRIMSFHLSHLVISIMLQVIQNMRPFTLHTVCIRLQSHIMWNILMEHLTCP